MKKDYHGAHNMCVVMVQLGCMLQRRVLWKDVVINNCLGGIQHLSLLISNGENIEIDQC